MAAGRGDRDEVVRQRLGDIGGDEHIWVVVVKISVLDDENGFCGKLVRFVWQVLDLLTGRVFSQSVSNCETTCTPTNDDVVCSRKTSAERIHLS